MSEPEEISRIKEKLSALKNLDKDFRVFGASAHRYRLLPPLSESQAEIYEREDEIKLPADYRLFLTQIGNGGAGPFYGVHPYQRARKNSQPRVPFKWSGENPVNFADDRDLDKWDEERWGVLDICEQGCGTNNFLVVNGDACGKIGTQVGFDYVALSRFGFLEFYENWLDRNFKSLQNEPLFDRVKIGMTRQEVVEIFGKEGINYPATDSLKKEFNEQATKLLFPYVSGNFLIVAGIVVRIYRHGMFV